MKKVAQKFIVAFALALPLLVCRSEVCLAQSLRELKGEHFIVEYEDGVDKKMAQEALRKAEYYYDQIASRLGYARYDNFWTWDNRTKIIIYSDKESYVDQTNVPRWSIGVTFHDERLYQSRTIITYPRDKGFYDGVLPHEIAHLILRDFIGKDAQVPHWFEEGVAQLCEKQKISQASRIMRFLVKRNKYIPFKTIMSVDIAKSPNAEDVSLFYAQSVSMVDFLIKQYGNRNFVLFCKSIRDGNSLPESLKKVYSLHLDSLDDYEKKWVEYMESH